MEDYGLDFHNEMILEEYRLKMPDYVLLRHVVMQQLDNFVSEVDIELNQMDSRIKAEKSLVGKLLRKGHKYQSLADITDILGVRVIAYYNEDVDRIASMAEKYFDIDWPNSVDKRKMHQFDSFGPRTSRTQRDILRTADAHSPAACVVRHTARPGL